MLFEERSSARRSRPGLRLASEAMSGSAYPRERAVWLRTLARKVSSTLLARDCDSLLGGPEIGVGDGLGEGVLSGSWSPPLPASVLSRVEPSESGGLPWPKSWRASST